MVFTSYYGQMRNFPDNVTPVAISRGIPDFYNGDRILDFAPPGYVFSTYKTAYKKEAALHFIDNTAMEKMKEWYTKEYLKHLDSIGPSKIKTMIEGVLPLGEQIWTSDTKHIALLCYEKTGDFCHRNLLSAYLREHNLPCREADKEELLEMKEEQQELEEYLTI